MPRALSEEHEDEAEDQRERRALEFHPHLVVGQIHPAPFRPPLHPGSERGERLLPDRTVEALAQADPERPGFVPQALKAAVGQVGGCQQRQERQLIGPKQARIDLQPLAGGSGVEEAEAAALREDAVPRAMLLAVGQEHALRRTPVRIEPSEVTRGSLGVDERNGPSVVTRQVASGRKAVDGIPELGKQSTPIVRREHVLHQIRRGGPTRAIPLEPMDERVPRQHPVEGQPVPTDAGEVVRQPPHRIQRRERRDLPNRVCEERGIDRSNRGLR